MKRVMCLALALIIATSMFFLSACSNNKEESAYTPTNVNYVSLDNGFPNTKVFDEQSALKAISSISESFGIADVEKELKVESVESFEEDSYYRMQQYYNDIPVYGRSIILAANENGEIIGIESNTDKIQDVNTNPKLSINEVEKKIKKYLNASKNDDISFIPKSGLVIYSLDDVQFFLSYDLIVSFADDKGIKRNYECIINADSGEIIRTISLDINDVVDGYGSDNEGKNRSFIVNHNPKRGEYTLNDETRNIKIYNVGNKCLDWKYYDSNNNEPEYFEDIDHIDYLADGKTKLEVLSSSNNQWDDHKSVSLMANLKDTYDFYADVLNRKGTNGKNNIINGFYNDSMPSMGSGNAYSSSLALYWQKEIILSFGTDNQIHIDTVGHEFTHAVERSISGMEYIGESGALMEAYSDIFGELIQDYSNDGIMNGNNDWIHGKRNLIDPESNNYPSEYKGKHFKTTEDRTIFGINNDHGHVHTNCTVIAHAAYLMFNGIDGNENMKINSELLAKIWYRSLLFLHSNSNFEQCANAVYKSATTQHGITKEQLSCIKKAFESVGITLSGNSLGTAFTGSRLFVKDTNLKNYDNYHLTITSLKDIRNPKIVVDNDIADSSGFPLNLNEGNYTISVSDNDQQGSSDTFNYRISIVDLGMRNQLLPVNIYTNFGGIIAEDFTMPQDLVVTLGEISVIEPEIIPNDAIRYSINWSSSDESVATVSPTGEAGIVTALSKGTTTITAELSSGGKTITKTTNLRVASKARDTVLVLDVSGSMYGTPIAEMKKSAIQFCNDLLKDEYNNRVGIVFYDNKITTIDLTNDLNMLINRIESISDGATTNMEGGLSAADQMLKDKGKSDSIKNVVIMADGLPNEGKTSYSGSMPNNGYYGYNTSIYYASAVIDKAQAMQKEYNIYSLGFFHSLSGNEKDFGTTLMKKLVKNTDDYYLVDKAEDLQFAFGDISDNINYGSKIVINIACPVDVTVSFGGEKLSSASADYNDKASFGTLLLLGKNKDIKVVSLDSNKQYDVEIVGTGSGKMDYSVNYFDAKEQISDYRSFETVPITQTTIITSNTDNSSQDIALNIDEDGDGEIDTVWTATAKGKGTITYEKNPPEPEELEDVEEVIAEPEEKNNNIWVIVILCAIVFLIVISIAVALVLANQSVEKEKTEDKEEIDLPINLVSNKKNEITEDGISFTGTISVLTGSMNGFSIPIKDGETLYLGKDQRVSNLVFSTDYSNVSRLHCSVTYDAKTSKYYVVDSSANGTFVGKKRLIKGKRTPVESNTIIALANEDCSVLLG